MAKNFTFDGALMFPFRAAHARSFIWKYTLAFGVVGTALTGLFIFFAKDAMFSFVDTMTQLEASGTDDPSVIFGAMARALGAFTPWIVLGTLASWVVWAMFTTATQRRYIRDEDFSLGFGSDEVRMMGTGFVWYAAQWAFSLIPLLIMWPVIGSVTDFYDGTITEDQFVRAMFGRVGYVMLAMLVTFPLLAFLATRFSPVFAMTVKEEKVAFGDAWIVSRNRFWPILGAYLIIALVGGMAIGLVSSLAQMILMPAMMNMNIVTQDDMPDLRALFTPAVMISMLVYMFVRLSLSGLLMHVVHAPAAFAARHDPRGSIDDALRVKDFE